MSSINEVNSIQKRHARKLKNIQKDQDFELEKIKFQHEKNKHELRKAQKEEELTMISDHRKELAQSTLRNEQTLNRLKNSLEKTKEYTTKEKERIKNNHLSEVELMKQNQESKIINSKEKTEMVLEDLDHQGNIELKRLQSRIKEKQTDLKQNGNDNIRIQKADYNRNYQQNKEIYSKKQMAQKNKFDYALLKQRKQQGSQIVGEERKFQKRLLTRQKIYDNELKKSETDFKTKKNISQVSFENNYKEFVQKNESKLQGLVGKKDKIIQKLRSDLKIEAKKIMEKNEDPFYHDIDLQTKLSFDNINQEYTLRLPIPKHEVSTVNLTAQNKELKLGLSRHFEMNEELETGSEIIKKQETIVRKIKLDEIIDPRSVKKDYIDGELIYKIKLA